MKIIHVFGKSVSHAVQGFLLAFRTERNFRIHLIVAGFVLIGMSLLPLARWERVILLLAIAAVLVLELLNSMIERLLDLVKPRMHAYVHDIKDMMAAAVFIASIAAMLIGLAIFLPHRGEFLERL